MDRSTFEPIRRALCFYADESNWVVGSGSSDGYSAVENDDGALARKALAALEKDSGFSMLTPRLLVEVDESDGSIRPLAEPL